MSFELTPDEAKKVIKHLSHVHSNLVAAWKAIEQALKCIPGRPTNALPAELETAAGLLREVDGILTCWMQNRPREKESYSAT
jgi:hypothetical protein